MQITAFKAMWREISITGCEDYENTFARKESDCTLRFGFKVLMTIIFVHKTDKFVPTFVKHFETFQQVLGDRPVHVLVIIGSGGGLLFMSFDTIV